MAEKIKSRRNASLDYWERREKEALKQTRASEEEFAEKIGQVYKDMRKDINDRINRWYVRYANDSEIDITEAKKRVSKLDIEEYAELAKKYVALSRSQETRAEAFTDEANEQMKIYNLTMKVNRLENLKAQMGLDLCGGFSKLQKNYGEFLTDQMMQEFTRQSGILGMTTTNPRRFRRQMEAIVNGSFHNATFSQRLWNQQDALKGELDRLLTRALIQGLNPRTVAPELKKKFDSSEQAADLLMITELCRVQTEAQKLAFQEFGYDDYTFICNGGACKECEALNGKHFKVKDMQAGRNAPPMHPRCRCSTAAYMDREAFEKWLEGNALKKSVEIPPECQYLRRVDTNFSNKEIDQDVLRDIDTAISKQLSKGETFSFSEIKVGKFPAEKEKSVFITDTEYRGWRITNKLYLNHKFFIGKTKKEIDAGIVSLHENGWWQSKDLSDLVNHEIMHAKIGSSFSYEKANRLYEELEHDKRTKGFCRLVDVQPGEFLNEMYVAICRGDSIDEKYLSVYNEYIKEFW